MRAFWKLTWTEAKLFLREPVATFFTLLFPLLLLFVFGAIFGNEPYAPGGYGSVDYSVPGYIAIMIGALSLIGVPITLASYRERGILRRFRVAPVPAWWVLGAQAVVALGMVLLGTLLVVAAAYVAFDLRLPQHPGAITGAVVFGSLSFFAIGALLGGVLPTARTAQAVGMALFFPMLFLSGAAMPRMLFPDLLQYLSLYLPLTHVVLLLQDLWMGPGWNLMAALVLLLLLVGCGVAATRWFRWT